MMQAKSTNLFFAPLSPIMALRRFIHLLMEMDGLVVSCSTSCSCVRAILQHFFYAIGVCAISKHSIQLMLEITVHWPISLGRQSRLGLTSPSHRVRPYQMNPISPFQH